MCSRRRSDYLRIFCIAPASLIRCAALVFLAITCQPASAVAQEDLRPGEAFVTRFSGTIAGGDASTINRDGTVASAVDLRNPAGAPQGAHWADEPQHLEVTAGEVGQVFGVTLDDATPPNIYLTATSAFGLHRTQDNAAWMDGMWGPGGGPGTVYRLSAANGYAPEVFAEILLDGRPNSGAALGNIAFDRQNRQLFVSDLETGMIHRLALDDGADLGYYNHGEIGRIQFLNVETGAPTSVPAAAFVPATQAGIEDCAEGDFTRTPSCWNFADFRRRVWGLAVRHDALSGDTRLFYATWGSEGFGNPAFAGANEDRLNAVWSIGLDPSGDFVLTDVRREFLLPSFNGAADGTSRPVASLTFSACGVQDVMLLAERGGVRNLGLGARDAFSRPYESRVLRYELGDGGQWQLAGRYDAGFYDRSEQGPPHLRANAAGGAAFGPGFDDSWQVDGELRNDFVWLTGDNLCTRLAACVSPATGARDDTTEVHGLQGLGAEVFSDVLPDAATSPYPVSGPATPADAPSTAFMIDLGEAGARDATTIGSLAVYQTCPPEEMATAGLAEELIEAPFDMADVPAGEAWPEDYYPEEPFPEDFYPAGDEWADGGGWPDGGIFPDDFDELAETFDFAIAKLGPDECQEGAECAYTIEITNAGADPFFGPLAFTDTMPADATFVDGPAGWACAAAGGDVSCHTEAPVELAVAGSTTVDLTATMPFGIAGEEVENCVAFDWAEMGFSDREGDTNDEACIFTPILERFDLGITKTVDGECHPAGPCPFDIVVTNHGPGTFTGSIVLEDTVPENASFRDVSGEGACVREGDDFSCSLPPRSLEVDESVDMRVEFRVDSDAGDELTNCVSIAWDRMAASDGEDDPNPDEACETIELLTEGYDISIEKTGPANCRPGETCSFEIIWSNLGPEIYDGDIVGVDGPYGAAGPITSMMDWCHENGDIICEDRGRTFDPGVGAGGTITFEVPDPPGDTRIGNCFGLDWDAMTGPGTGDINEDNDRVCLSVDVGDGPDFTIAKAADAECVEGGLCTYSLTITNIGADYEGLLAISDDLPEGAVVRGGSFGWTCSNNEAGAFCRTNEEVELPEGTSASVELEVELPGVIVADVVQNCAYVSVLGMDLLRDDDMTNNGPACVDTTIVDDVGLLGATECDRGSACPVGVRVVNFGGRKFTGMFAVEGAFDVPVEILNVVGPNSGWSCEILGLGRYRCGRTRPLQLEKASEEKISIVLNIPEDFPRNFIEHGFWMVRPLGEKRDADASNDANVSIIKIKGPLPDDGRRRPVRPELGISKTAPATCMPGGDCTYTVTITNNGPGTYEGILLIEDYAPGSTHATFVSVSPGWSCVETGPSMTCRYAPAELATGESISFDITVNLPTDLGAYGETMVDDEFINCAWIVRPYGTIPLGMDEEMALRFAVEQDLATEGFLDPSEVDGVFNAASTAALEAYQRARGLRVSGDADEATLDFMFPGSTQMTGDSVGENDKACASSVMPPRVEPVPPVVIAAVPDLAITKIARQASCTPGEPCSFAVSVANRGAGTFVGPLQFSDTVSASRTRLTKAGPAPLSCRASRSGITCAHPATTLAPGEARNFQIVLTPQTRGEKQLENCVSFLWNDTARVFAVQNALNELGFDAGRADGKAGPNTRRAVRAYQQSAGMATTGRIDPDLLTRIFPSWGSGDGNAVNDRSCSVVALGPQPEPPDRPAEATPLSVRCQANMVRNSQGQCVCPQSRPVWTGQTCVPRVTPQVQPQRCPANQVRNNKGQCICPSNLPVWTGQVCIGRPTQACPMGFMPVDRSKAKNLVQRGWEIRQEGNLLCARQRQTPTVTPSACLANQVRNPQGQCVCPANKPVWNGQVCMPRFQVIPQLRVQPQQQRQQQQQQRFKRPPVVIPQLQQFLR